MKNLVKFENFNSEEFKKDQEDLELNKEKEVEEENTNDGDIIEIPNWKVY